MNKMAFNGMINLILLQQLVNADERLRMKLQRRHLRDTSDPFSLPDTAFIRSFRLPKQAVVNLLLQLGPFLDHFPKRSTGIPIQLKVFIALYFFAHGSYQKCVGNNFVLAVDQSVVSRCIKEVSNVMIRYMMAQLIQFPRHANEQNRIRQSFNQKFGMPGVLGAIDCTHVAIVAPNMNDPVRPGHAYLNRKGFYSLNVEMICDSNLKILFCNARHPGSSHDSGIWAISSAKRFLEHQYILGQIPNTWLLGDSGYPLQPWLMTPVLDAVPNGLEDNYNKLHIQTRNTIERLFGTLKQRFRCLLRHRVLHYDPLTAGKIVYCCAILHNMCLNYGVNIDEVDADEHEHQIEPVIGPAPANDNNHWIVEARRIRNNLIQRLGNN